MSNDFNNFNSKGAIVDNRGNGTVGGFLEKNILNHSELRIVSAYFTIFAYYRLKEKLNEIKELNFLFGEPTFIKDLDPAKSHSQEFKIEDNRLVIPIEKRLEQKQVSLKCAKWISEKVNIKSIVKPNFLHGKLFHIIQESGIEKAIVGSSNFTVNGLGFGSSPNIELNVIIDSDRDREEIREWFDSLWNDTTGLVQDVKEEVLKYLQQLYIDNDPEFIYYKTLYHIFNEFIDEQDRNVILTSKSGFFESEIWNMLYDFQKDGVKGSINKILKHNGCIIADSVGLGKTFEALAVIKYFESLNYRVLVLCPKKLANNWKIYQSNQNSKLSPFKKDKFNFTLLYHTDMGRVEGISDANGIDFKSFNWSSYDLVVIDESHNFKGNALSKVNDAGELKMNRAKWLLEKIIKEGGKTKVLLLSATPVNNNLKDLRNQIYLITEGNDNALYESMQIKNIGQILKNAQTIFTTWADRKNKNKSVKNLMERLDASFFRLLDELTIARSRKHIKKFYKTEEEIGKFPIRKKPISIYTQIDLKNRSYDYDKINEIILKYKLSVFNPSAYVKKEAKNKYEEKAKSTGVTVFTQNDRENYLIGMMKVNFLKRLESSIESFEISIDRTITKIENIVSKISCFKQNNIKIIIEEPEIIDELDEDTENDNWVVGKKLQYELKDIELDKWLNDLENDKQALIELYNFSVAVTPDRDAKLKKLTNLIEEKVTENENKKILIFTAFADTANYLYDSLVKYLKTKLNLNMALVVGSYTKTTYGKNDFDNILVNFSPKSKKRELIDSVFNEEIDILIATDCISEGQNLQDCDYLINYDIHWNPVRIIQRFGRIDRLGSTNEYIQMVNFWPTENLDKYINLKERVESRMALVDIAATTDDNPLSNEQIEELIEEDLKYRNKQLKKLQNEVIELEDMDEGLSLTDCTLDDYRIELLNFLDKNREKLDKAPLGLFSVVPTLINTDLNKNVHNEITPIESDIIKPGIIFCLRQKTIYSENITVNPLNPYFLIYIRSDGTVRFNYTNAKNILEIFRLLCEGNNKPFEELCNEFNNETNNGNDMTTYSNLLKKGLDAIIESFNKKANLKLTLNDRSAKLLPKSNRVGTFDDFELVTWLILK